MGKIQAAVEARGEGELVIIARTDARAPLGLEEAIARGRAYIAAGADKARDAINRHLYNDQSFVETVIHRVFVMIYRIFVI